MFLCVYLLILVKRLESGSFSKGLFIKKKLKKEEGEEEEITLRICYVIDEKQSYCGTFFTAQFIYISLNTRNHFWQMISFGRTPV